ncbi:MAG TPA: hypothetical protein VLW50_19360 [Streptosporangiaceae bacterium]|nr:hypothetical protein [Streptosporangiaceae bacterium]
MVAPGQTASRPSERLARIGKYPPPLRTGGAIDRRDHAADVSGQHIPIGVPANTQKPGDPAKPCHDLNGTRSVRYEVTEAPEGTDPLGPGCLEDRIQGEVVAVDVR